MVVGTHGAQHERGHSMDATINKASNSHRSGHKIIFAEMFIALRFNQARRT